MEQVSTHPHAGGDIRSCLARCPLVLILGVGPRSGTNYLSNLIYLHQECDRVAGIWEDFVVSGASLLQEYVDRVTGHWNWAGWGIGAETKQALWNSIGSSIVAFLIDHRQSNHQSASGKHLVEPKCVVTKTPSVENLALAHQFPNTRTVVIVRDGRSMVSSGMKGFGWTFDHATHRWAGAARSIIKARDAGQDFLLVRYEDLLIDLPNQMNRILHYVGLEASTYDLISASNLPMTGSSFVPGTDRIHWGKLPRGDVSALLCRYQDWTPSMHCRFERIAGDAMQKFGYEVAGRFTRHQSITGWAARLGHLWCSRREMS